MIFPRKVYAIQHNKTKRILIGSATDVEKRYRSTIWNLRSGKHKVKDLQDDFIQYGEDFSLYIIDEIKCPKERHKEFEWIEKYETCTRGIGYNYQDKKYIQWANSTPVPLKDGHPGDDWL